ncbi:acetoacetate decarboxylase family protein [Oceanicoccus sp. KOV_DT_Chl]|uniref:acetoacetate decarboxylase family protein n=1 Tax=Oceanicoccus sp. KOV_DT_Chl TaxID=1904639 RepID=UPI000C7A2599|nr:acetoacetate decarboxylase family protein [Oceanicoccus sp. KOV_DT_Chl]
MSELPQGNPGDCLNWPMLKIKYLTDPENIAKLLPPGIEPGSKPEVTLTVYNFPVNGHPEFGLVTAVAAKHDGKEGEFALGYAIDRESEIFISQEKFGQPKYPAKIDYFRLMDYVEANVTHQNYTFLEFKGQVTETLDPGPEFVVNEFWVKYSRKASYTEPGFDFPPHVVDVYSKYGTALKQKVVGELTLRESPWDPIAQNLPVKSELDAYLWTPIFLDRTVNLGKPLDADAFEPFASTIGNSRWPGENGGPKKS